MPFSSTGYLLGMFIISIGIAFFVYRDSKDKKKTVAAFILTFAALALIDYIK